MAIIAIAALFTGCGSSSPKDVTMTQAIDVSILKFDAEGAKCDLCNATENVCALNVYESEVGVGECEAVAICENCCKKNCDYCGENEAKYLCFSMIGYPILVCEDDLNAMQQGF